MSYWLPLLTKSNTTNTKHLNTEKYKINLLNKGICLTSHNKIINLNVIILPPKKYSIFPQSMLHSTIKRPLAPCHIFKSIVTGLLTTATLWRVCNNYSIHYFLQLFAHQCTSPQQVSAGLRASKTTGVCTACVCTHMNTHKQHTFHTEWKPGQRPRWVKCNTNRWHRSLCGDRLWFNPTGGRRHRHRQSAASGRPGGLTDGGGSETWTELKRNKSC